ncbi:MAG: hypothetical protein JWO48_438 [Bryobacterales bacterium]|nr:hypothetical protein [Bryobacterales bacterium]
MLPLCCLLLLPITPCSGAEYREGLKAQSPVDAELLFRRAAEADPSCANARVNLGLSLAAQGRLSEAESETRTALRIAPNSPLALAALGKILNRLGRKQESINVFEQATAVDNNSEEAWQNLGIALADIGERERARRAFSRAVRVAPKSARAHSNLGRTLLELLRYAEARTELDTARELDPQNLNALSLLTLAEKGMGHHKRTAVLATQWVAQDPGSAEGHFVLGQAELNLGNRDAGIADLKRATELDENHAEALYALSRAIADSDPEAARGYAERVKALKRRIQESDRLTMLRSQAVASAAAGDWPGAIAQFRDALDLCGNCTMRTDLEKSLGLAYCHAGDFDSGEFHLLAVQKLKPADPDVKQALKLITERRRNK